MGLDSNVLLISPGLSPEVAKRVAVQTQENLGIGYLASFLGSKKITVDMVDLNSLNMSLEQMVSMASSQDYLLVGISVHSPDDLEVAVNFADRFRNAGAKAHITLGGHYVSRKDDEILAKYRSIDSVVRGEGEFTLYELYSALRGSSSLNPINGLSFKALGNVVKNRNRLPITNLDSLPFPMRYNLSNLLLFKQKSANMLTSRGCPGGCSFCVASLNKGWRMRSADNVLEEIRSLYSLGIRTIVFEDDNYLGGCIKGKRRAEQIADGLVNLNLGIRYQLALRVDDLDDNLLEKFSASGVYRMRVGIESFNQRQLTMYNKRTTPEGIKEGMQKIINSGIEPHFSFITFDPYVSLDELDNTARSMRKFAGNIHFRYVTAPLVPIEGSVIWGRLMQDNLLKKENERYSFRFVNQDSSAVWENVKQFKKYMADIEGKSQEFSKMTSLVYNDKRDEELLRLQGFKREIDFRMTTLWLDLLQHSISSIRENPDYRLVNIPNQIKEQHDQLRELLK